MATLKITELEKVAKALNIEGGDPAIDLKKNDFKNIKIWANTILVLDRPLIDNILFDELVANNKFPLLENAIDEINEHSMLASYLMIIGYYLEFGRSITDMKDNEKLNITIHLHQDKASMPLLDIIKKQLDNFIKYSKIQMKNINLDYRTDNVSYITTSKNYNDTHILISLSQCAGLAKDHPAGTFVMAYEFIPYSIDHKTIQVSRKYTVNNDLFTRLNMMLKSKYNKLAVDYINENYFSYNPTKNESHCAKVFVDDDFKVTSVLQVDKLWNPTDRDEMVKIC